ncbi:Unknown protein sequence [Pseudomonas syringae pv. coryli]|uniref:Uncharacterized protein n=1 Tax=Pseudomonas syringae pv. coryli TaxID=317659 RepID=A0A0P9PPE8_9PSED|nr:Unknown protein sequence [Pseudomonas syringae pv. coryli]
MQIFSVDNSSQPLLFNVYRGQKGCRETVPCLCRTFGKAVHGTLFYPQASYAQSSSLTYAMG